MLTQEIVNTLIQLAIALAVAGGAWLFFARRRASLTAWLGLGAPAAGWWKGTILCALVVALVSIPLFLFGGFAELARGEGTVGAQFAGQSLTPAIIATIVLVACVKTALTEEIIFRGLIAKRLIGWLGFAAGNMVQAILFGSIHLLIFAADGAPAPTPLAVATVVGLPAFAGWMMGYANERFGGGTIWPGWLIHATGNLTSFAFLASLAS